MRCFCCSEQIRFAIRSAAGKVSIEDATIGPNGMATITAAFSPYRLSEQFDAAERF
jgi:hypothetical protein